MMTNGLVDAADEGDVAAVRQILAAGADVNYTTEGDDGETAQIGRASCRERV